MELDPLPLPFKYVGSLPVLRSIVLSSPAKSFTSGQMLQRPKFIDLY